MKKISFIDQFYKHGGIEKLVAIKANYWVSHFNPFNYQVSILSTENKDKEFIYKLDRRVIFKDLKINYNNKISYFSPKNILVLIKNSILIQKLITNNKNGFLVKNNNINFFVDTIDRIIKNSNFQEISENALHTSKKYNLDLIMQQWKNKIFI